MSPRQATAVPFTSPFTQADLRAAGCSPALLRGWLERRQVVDLAPGVYAPAVASNLPMWRLVHTSKSVTQGQSPVSVMGAAAIHGLWTPPDPHPSLLRSPDEHEVPERHLMQRSGLLVPSKAWTSVQLARWQRLPGALISLDAALNAGVDRGVLLAVVHGLQCWPGAARLEWAIGNADGNSGSPLESWSRGLMILNDLPLPILQKRIQVDGFVYYADFAWEGCRLIGEADGRGKYENEQEIANEKRRQARLQACGYTVYRWGWPEVRGNAAAWVHGLRLALARIAA